MSLDSLKLYAVLLGGREEEYLFEQHKYIFCVAGNFEEVKTKVKEFWPRAKSLHIDVYICLDQVCGHRVILQDDCNGFPIEVKNLNKKLFFVNLGGYKQGVSTEFFTEIHKPIFVVAKDKTEAKIFAKQDSFFEDKALIQTEESRPHVDDVVDVDEVLSAQAYSVKLEKITDSSQVKEPEVVITGFLQI